MRKEETEVFAVLVSAIVVIAVMPMIAMAAGWPQFQKDEIATGWTTDNAPVYNPPELVWWKSASGTGMGGIDITPVVADGAVYVLDYKGYLWSFNAKTGEENWQTKCNAADGTFELSAPAYNDGIVFVAASSGSAGNGAGRINAIYADNGTIRESCYYGLNGFQINTPVRYADGKIYFGNWKGGASHTEDNGTYYCVNASNVCDLLWSRTAPYATGYYWAGAAIVGDYIIYGDDRANVTCLNKDTGAFVDYVNVSGACGITPVERIGSSIVWNEETGRIYFTGKKSSPISGHAYAVAFNATTGDLGGDNAVGGGNCEWNSSIGYTTSTPVVYDGRVYVGIGSAMCGGSGVKCLNEADGTLRYGIDKGVSQASPAVSVACGRVHIYFTTNENNGSAYCIEDNGTALVERWEWNPPAPDDQYILQGMAISEGMVYFGTDYGRIYALAEPQEIIWQGTVTLINGTTFNVTAHNSGESYAINQTTALGALVDASEAGDFNYSVNDEWYASWGLIVDSIADIPNEGWDGWMYWVNYPDEPIPNVSANKYNLEDGDVVTWYWSSSMEMTPDDSPKVLIINVTVSSNEFDTGKGSYPSISGTHYGTIIPKQNIMVEKVYTYPCAGTGGHSECVKIWNETLKECVVAAWNGYVSGYHNLTFNATLTLKEGVIYNYSIETGSYPQIIHAPYKQVTGGNITCTRFVDVNGKEYNDWIPAIRLW